MAGRRMTFDQLFRISDPKRVTRSFTVKGPPLDIDPSKDSVYYAFNFKSHPSTTGLRHRGYVKFFRPRSNQPEPVQHLQCMVDCTCPDYRYRWAWVNKQRNSSAVGPKSLNQAWNKAPRITNPHSVPGLCKHILATRDYIYGLLSAFPSNKPDTSDKLDKLVTYATKRWADFPGARAAAKERDRLIRQRAHVRNVAGPAAIPEPPLETPGQPPELPPEVELPKPPADDLAAAQGAVPPQAPPEAPLWPSIANIQVPKPPYTVKTTTGEPEAKSKGKPAPKSKPAPKAKTEPTKTKPATPSKTKPGAKPGAKPGSKPRSKPGGKKGTSNYGESMNVVKLNGETNMNDLTEALKIVEAMEDEMMATGDQMGMEGGGAPDLPPSEPPISDTAIGADTEGETALSLLSQMRDSLSQIAAAFPPPEGEAGMEGGGAPPGAEGLEGAEGGEEGGEFGELGVPEPEAGEPGEEEGEEGEAEEEDEGEEEDEEETEEDEEAEPAHRRPV